MSQTMTVVMLKASLQLISAAGRKDRSELRDAARNNAVIFSGTYAACVKEAKRRGVWYGK